MQTTLTPGAERLSAALKALRLTEHPDESKEGKLAFAAKCLKVVIAHLAEEGVPQADLDPLIQLEAHLKAAATPDQSISPSPSRRDRRRSASPSLEILARASALIDLLVRGGYEENEAAQTIMRRLIASGVPAPAKGGDARGWKRLLEFRNDMLHGIGPPEAVHEYKLFTSEIEKIPPSQRLQRVFEERLWDRRQPPR
jgi:hypothetical protein